MGGASRSFAASGPWHYSLDTYLVCAIVHLLNHNTASKRQKRQREPPLPARLNRAVQPEL